MPPKGWKSINVKEEDFELIKKIAQKRGMNNYSAVVLAFQNTFPNDFPKKLEA